MVIEEKNLLKERRLENWLDYELLNDSVLEAIGIVKEYYDFTKAKIRYNLFMRRGYVNERNQYGEYHTCIRAKYLNHVGGAYLIQIVDYGEILFSEIYYKDIPTKEQLINELESLMLESPFEEA